VLRFLRRNRSKKYSTLQSAATPHRYPFPAAKRCKHDGVLTSCVLLAWREYCGMSCVSLVLRAFRKQRLRPEEWSCGCRKAIWRRYSYLASKHQFLTINTPQVAESCRIAESVRVRVASFPAHNFDQLLERLQRVPFRAYFPQETDLQPSINVRVTSEGSSLYHTG
jgi:hypothetical protein